MKCVPGQRRFSGPFLSLCVKPVHVAYWLIVCGMFQSVVIGLRKALTSRLPPLVVTLRLLLLEPCFLRLVMLYSVDYFHCTLSFLSVRFFRHVLSTTFRGGGIDCFNSCVHQFVSPSVPQHDVLEPHVVVSSVVQLSSLDALVWGHRASSWARGVHIKKCSKERATRGVCRSLFCVVTHREANVVSLSRNAQYPVTRSPYHDKCATF